MSGPAHPVRDDAADKDGAPDVGAPGLIADHRSPIPRISLDMIRKLKSGDYRLYSRKKNPSTGKRRNLGTFSSRAKAEQHERAVQYFKRH